MRGELDPAGADRLARIATAMAPPRPLQANTCALTSPEASGEPVPDVVDWTPKDEPTPAEAPAPESDPESEPMRDETPAPAEPAESNQGHQNGVSAPVAEEPVSEPARGGVEGKEAYLRAFR